MRSKPSSCKRALRMLLSGVVAMSASGVLLAQSAPPDFVASPDIYKVIAQSDQFMIVQGVWKPGQRDQFHSHPAQLYYWLSDCHIRWLLPDGSARDIAVQAGQSGSMEPVASHSVQNIGTADCKVLMFEARAAL